MKKILFALVLSCVSGGAFAACPAIPLAILDGGGVSRNMGTATAADGTSCVSKIDADTASQIHADLTAPIPAGTNSIGSVTQVDGNFTGTISATDASGGGIPAGTGLFNSTAPTASSFVFALIPGGSSQVDIQITGTATGTYVFEHSNDSTTGSDGNWIATNFRQTGIVNTVLGFSVTTNGMFRGNSAGFKYVRVRNVGGTTPSNPIVIRLSNGSGTAFLNASLPAGNNSIGTVGADPSKGAATPTQAFLALPATTTTQIIALSGTKVTYVTLSKVLAGGTVNVTFKYGTGSNCGTGTTTLEGPYPLTAQAGWVEGNGAGPVMVVPSGQALCVTTDASVTGGVKLIYQQI